MTTDARPIDDDELKPPAVQTHDVKSWPNEYQALVDGRKTAEWRRNDRNYQVGDVILFREWEPVTVPSGAHLGEPQFEADTGGGSYTGRVALGRITDVVAGREPRGRSFGMPEQFAMLSVALAMQLDIDDEAWEWEWKPA